MNHCCCEVQCGEEASEDSSIFRNLSALVDALEKAKDALEALPWDGCGSRTTRAQDAVNDALALVKETK